MCGGACVETEGGDVPGGGAACEVALLPIVGDNAPQVNAAIVALNATGGGTVCLAPGAWTCSSPILLLDNVSLKGAGYATVISWLAPYTGTNDPLADSLIVGNDADHCDVYDLRIVASGPGVTDTMHCVYLQSAASIRLRQVGLEDALEDGINLADGTVIVQVERCVELGCDGYFMQLVSCSIVDVVSCVASSPIALLPVEGEVVTRVNVRGQQMDIRNPDTDPWCIQISGDEGQGDVADVLIEAGQFVTNRHAAQIAGTDVDRVKLVACSFRTGGNSAVSGASFNIQGGADVELDACHVEITAYTDDVDVLECAGSTNVVKGCTLIGTTNDTGRVTVACDAGDVSLLNNPSIIGPLAVNAGVVSSRIVGNTIDLLGTVVVPAVTLDNTNRCDFESNRVTSGTIGVLVDGDPAQIRIRNNTIEDWSTTGIDAGAATTVTEGSCDGNTLRTTAGIDGIILAAGMTCRNNKIDFDGTGGNAGIVGANDVVVQNNVVHENNADFSILFIENTGYVCFGNSIQSVLIEQDCTPSLSAFNPVIA